MTDKKTPTDEIAVDFATLARLAAAQAYDDVRLLLARLIRKYRVLRPELDRKSTRLNLQSQR